MSRKLREKQNKTGIISDAIIGILFGVVLMCLSLFSLAFAPTDWVSYIPISLGSIIFFISAFIYMANN